MKKEGFSLPDHLCEAVGGGSVQGGPAVHIRCTHVIQLFASGSQVHIDYFVALLLLLYFRAYIRVYLISFWRN